jgi:enoyl-CoA hydratase/carnithine racemase
LRERGEKPWHNREEAADARFPPALAETVMARILAVLLGRTYFVVDRGICAAAELNWMTRMALGFRTGLLDLAGEIGSARVSDLCKSYAALHPGFEVPACVDRGSLPRFRASVQVERRDGIGLVSVFRPEVKNALSARTVEEIDDAFAELFADPRVAGILFSSWDGALAGADVNELAALPDAEACRNICRRSAVVLARIASAKKPVVAAVNGPVLGGGAEFAMACHARVVGPELSLGQPEVNLGIIPGYGGTQRLPRLIGVGRAAELLRSGRTISAVQACEWGWAHGRPESDVITAAIALLEKHLAGEVALAPVSEAALAAKQVAAASAPLDIGHRSRAIDAILVDVLLRGLTQPLAAGLEIEADGFARCKGTVDMDIGMKNFIQNGPRVPAVFLHE